MASNKAWHRYSATLHGLTSLSTKSCMIRTMFGDTQRVLRSLKKAVKDNTPDGHILLLLFPLML
jgi:hypothetical protein